MSGGATIHAGGDSEPGSRSRAERFNSPARTGPLPGSCCGPADLAASGPAERMAFKILGIREATAEISTRDAFPTTGRVRRARARIGAAQERQALCEPFTRDCRQEVIRITGALAPRRFVHERVVHVRWQGNRHLAKVAALTPGNLLFHSVCQNFLNSRNLMCTGLVWPLASWIFFPFLH